jgi:TonB family protein
MRVRRPLGLGLDVQALDAVRQWKFEPARRDGGPISVQANIEVNFRLL